MTGQIPFMERLFIPALAGLAVSIALLAVRSVCFRLLRRWADRKGTELDDVIFASSRIPSIFWCVAGGLYLFIELAELTPRHALLAGNTVHVLLIASLVIAAARLAGRLFKNFSSTLDLPLPTTGLIYFLLESSIIVLGVMIILGQLGIAITPILTALGVGGLAVALALKDTLANLFAGIHLMMEKMVRVGDSIRLEGGQEGSVVDVSWRTTHIRTPQNNLVIIPNNKLAQSIVTNFSMPEQSMSLTIPVSVGFDADIDRVEELLLDVAAKAAAESSHILMEPAPCVRFVPGFGPHSFDLILIIHIAGVADQIQVQHDLRKRIVRRFREDGISMPYPRRDVHVLGNA